MKNLKAIDTNGRHTLALLGPTQPVLIIELNSDGTLLRQWDRPGVLEGSLTLDGGWTAIGRNSPQSVIPDEARRFYRVRVE